MRMKVLSLFAAALLLAACETAPDNAAGSSGGGNVVPANQPAAAAAPAAPVGPAPGSVEEFVATVGDRVYFDLDKSVLKPDGQETLKRQAAWLKKYGGKRVTIEGHCDERGTREYNLALGEKRANAAKDYLVALGIDAGRIQTVSFGKERPVAFGKDEKAWSLNRRSVTIPN